MTGKISAKMIHDVPFKQTDCTDFNPSRSTMPTMNVHYDMTPQMDVDDPDEETKEENRGQAQHPKEATNEEMPPQDFMNFVPSRTIRPSNPQPVIMMEEGKGSNIVR